MGKALFFEAFSYFQNPTVHHVGWSYHVVSCLSRQNSRLGQNLDSLVVVYSTVTRENAIMPMRGVGI